MPTLKIARSWFYSAGTQYGWEGKGFDKRGVGIAKPLLEDYPRLFVEVDGQRYTLDCQKAQDFVKRFKSTEKRGKAKICVVSKSLLQKVDIEGRPIKEEEEGQVQSELLEQNSLFEL